jgi:hypothetical protein
MFHLADLAPWLALALLLAWTYLSAAPEAPPPADSDPPRRK